MDCQHVPVAGPDWPAGATRAGLRTRCELASAIKVYGIQDTYWCSMLLMIPGTP